ncbi:MAG TPA: pyridoxal 5'-phosphate synthase, partial [Solirubrobacteraceae bacterium]
MHLDPAEVASDPIEQFRVWFAAARETGIYEPEAMTLSTVDADGHPASRFVLLRGLDHRGFCFFTNYESAKGRQLAARPYAALTFGWLTIHRSVRVEGPVERLPEAESDAYFASRPRGAQLGAWASPQSAAIEGREQLDRALAAAE